MIITGFDIKTIFSEEGEGDFDPPGIVPLCPYDEWDEGQALRSHRLDEVGEIIGFFRFKIMYA